MALKPQGSFNGASTSLVALYDTFFARLFLLEPSMRAMFGDNMIRQSKFLVGLVNIMVSDDGAKQAPIRRFRGGGQAACSPRRST